MDYFRIVTDWILHPFKNYNELKEYREDYEKEIVSVMNENKKLKIINKELKTSMEIELLKKDAKIKYLIKENMKTRNEYVKELEKKQKTINMLRGKYGTAKKKIYKLEKS